MPVLILHVEKPPAFGGKKSSLKIGEAYIEKYEVSEKGGGGINVWLSLDELGRLKKQIDEAHELTRDTRYK